MEDYNSPGPNQQSKMGLQSTKKYNDNVLENNIKLLLDWINSLILYYSHKFELPTLILTNYISNN